MPSATSLLARATTARGTNHWPSTHLTPLAKQRSTHKTKADNKKMTKERETKSFVIIYKNKNSQFVLLLLSEFKKIGR